MPRGWKPDQRDSLGLTEELYYRHGIDEAGERDVRNAGVEEIISFEVSVITAILEVEAQNSFPSRCRLSHFKCNSACIIDYDLMSKWFLLRS
jgi:hypothetical protein